MTMTAHNTSAIITDAYFPALTDRIVSATGLVFYAAHPDTLAQHVADRLEERALDGCLPYLELLQNELEGEAELDELAARLTIGETFFFRHQELFDALRERVFPELIIRNQQTRRLRIWSAGCAIGAEPYSLAILLQREFAAQLAGWDVSIIATDINRGFLAQAQRGAFSDWALRSMPESLKASCFEHRDRTWTINDEFRGNVLFQYHNLVQHPFPALVNGLAAFDLILCRNVMIYFEPAMVSRLAHQFYDSLVEGGWFAVGPVEPNVETYRAFQTVNSRDVVLYRKGPQAAALAASPIPFAAKDVAIQLKNGVCRDRLATIAANGQPPVALNSLRGQLKHDQQKRLQTVVPINATLADARAKLNRGESDAAEECCRQLLLTEQMNPVVHFFHALVTEQQGRRGESIGALRRAIYLDRNFILAHYHLGLLLERNRDYLAAQRSYRNVLTLLQQRAAEEIFADADELTVGALRQLTEMQLEVLN